MEINWTDLILGAIGGGGLIKIFEIFINRFFKKKDTNDELKKAVELLLAKSHERDLEISKILLTILMEHSPDDKRAIEEEGLRYFGTLRGNSWIYRKYEKWAHSQGIDPTDMRLLHERNLKEQSKIDG